MTRHTWQSWRERYKKHSHRLDEKIGQIVADKRITQGEQGQIGYVRQPEEKPRRTRKKRNKAEDAMVDGDQDSNRPDESSQLSLLPISEIPSIGSDVSLPTQPPSFQNIQPLSSFSLPPSHTPIPLPPETGSAVPENLGSGEEEIDDNEESQWIVREGNESPPIWTKRKADDDLEQARLMKRHKSE